MWRKLQKSLVACWIMTLCAQSRIALGEWNAPFSVTTSTSDALSVTAESADAVTTLTWAAKGLAIAAATLLLVMCAKRLHREDYNGAMLTLIGALIAGASPYLSSVLMLG
jgi:hypothetical protein